MDWLYIEYSLKSEQEFMQKDGSTTPFYEIPTNERA